MRIFITGGTGFIGRFVVRRLFRGRDPILVLARKREDGMVFQKSRRLETVYGDLSSPEKWEKKVKKFRPDVCIHLAWEGVADWHKSHGVNVSVRNLEMGINLFRLLARIGCRKIVSSGSCVEYGATSGKIKEDHALKPQLPFSAAKISLSLMGEQVAKASGFNFVWLRFFHVFGPGKKSQSLVQYLLGRKKSGFLPELNNPKGGNDFIYVDDVARAVVMAVHKKGLNGIYNVGSGKITGTAQIANLIYGKKVLPTPSPRGFCADISKIKKVLVWRPKVSVASGIKKTAGYYRSAK